MSKDNCFNETSVVSAFIKECLISDHNSLVPIFDLHSAYAKYCQEKGHVATIEDACGLLNAFPGIKCCIAMVDGKKRVVYKGVGFK